MKYAALALAVLFLAGCGHYRTEAEEVRVTNSAATIYEAALAIVAGKDPAGPLKVILANASAIGAALDHPYPTPTPRTP